ncbi:MAG: TRAP transporter small permease [Octadecabacter sp.]|nr:TRAP transporter small permease [Octadecabacter sp.]
MTMKNLKLQRQNLLHRLFLGYDHIMGVVDRAAQWIIGLALGGVFVLLVTQVLVRYVLPFPLPWVEEAAVYLSGYVALIGASVCLRAGFHIQVDLLRDRLGPQMQYALVIFQQLLLVGFALFLLRYGIKFVELGWGQTSPSSYFLVSHARMAMPVGGLLLLLQAIAMIGRAVIGLSEERSPPQGPSAGGHLADI